MFCSYGASPRILRFFCWGKVIEWSQKAEFERWVRMMGKEKVDGSRAIISLKVWKVSAPRLHSHPIQEKISRGKLISALSDMKERAGPNILRLRRAVPLPIPCIERENRS